MKLKFLLFYICISTQFFSQEAFSHTYADTSVNNKFVVQLFGLMYEGYVGDQTVQLIDNENNSILWEKVFNRRGLGIPYVSNEGVVSLTESWQILSFYQQNGELISQIQLSEGESFFYDENPTESKFNAFVNMGKQFIAFIYNASSRNKYLICVDTRGKLNWKYELGRFYPCETSIFGEYILINDNCVSGDNTTYIFNIEGVLIKKMIEKL